MELEAERTTVCGYARKMTEDGLVVGTSGNISVRVGDLVAVTPSGVDYDTLSPEQIPVVRTDGSRVDGSLKPTSELPMHLSLYGKADDPDGAPISAVVHTHSVHATAVSTVADEVPPIHYMLAAVGNSVRVADYASFGTDELAESMLRAIAGRRGCLLSNHGTITYGDTLATAYDRARQLEWVCQLWLLAQSAGTPKLLPHSEIDNVVRKLRGYGQQ